MPKHLSVVTNATKNDFVRCQYTVLNHLKVLDNLVGEYLIVFDISDETGRIKKLHNTGLEDYQSLTFNEFKSKMELLDPRVIVK